MKIKNIAFAKAGRRKSCGWHAQQVPIDSGSLSLGLQLVIQF